MPETTRRLTDSAYIEWAYDCIMLHGKLADFRKPGKGIDVVWARDADVLYKHANKVCLRLWTALQGGAVDVDDDDRATLQECRKMTMAIKSRLGRIIALIREDPKLMAFLCGPNGLPEHRKSTLKSDFSPDSKGNDLVFKCLFRVLAKSAPKQGRTPQSSPAPVERSRVLHSVNAAGVIYWEDPEPLPKLPSAIEVARERRDTLAARVQEEAYRSAFKTGAQPRSQFRRFRN